MTDITERLRAVAQGEVTTEGLLMREAADLIEAQRARIGELEAMLNRVATALPVLETMLAVAGLNAGLAVAQELHAETRAALTEPTDEG